ncbi:dihydrofolate synthase/folylpolyglutamate synthase [Desulfitobacterium sp. LBE]|uniref:bifunctional folylpolyglutamate synthase/dihydrofolate synthase n=1 Tax=Desulfitobacterium sp. LBE TaxID=884086 RepID=UPI00119A42CD|nr:folylpolyglutamate synthase/dihydrofolate synthase family protein [Desulfitobacterium sp. LBE]TWH59859.1 dihydrofolate synthase/folylpolyglutamate synthase [Desulfitobacterium sp. LBE]
MGNREMNGITEHELKGERQEVSSVEQQYQEAKDYLVSLTKFGMNFGLGRIEELLKRVGNPEERLRVVHIGGTNGKGSTTMMTAEILEDAGYRVGVFTSPHLHDYRERITINGEMIPKGEVTRLIQILRPHLEELVQKGVEHPTEFEVNTAMALMYFADQKVDLVLLEVGLGGAIDSTNVVKPLISVITNVGMDHMDYLGETYEEIAGVKAGIIKAGAITVTAADRPEVLNVIRKKAQEMNSPLWVVGDDVRWEIRWSGELEQEFDLAGLRGAYNKLRLRLVGEHQVVNAATAVTVCELLKFEYGMNLERRNIYEGLRKAVWPGRLELLSLKPKVLIDGAHNVDGAHALAKALNIFQRQRLVLCLGMLGDKEREKVVDILVPLADEVIITKPNSPRSGNWEYLHELVKEKGKPVLTIEEPRLAVEEAFRRLDKEDMLCVTGSLYMIAEARQALLDVLRKG